ncbi:MAG: hypothetical protein ABIG43_04935, partial [Chloroflexota bacterium]
QQFLILHPHLLVLSCSLLSEAHPRQVLLKEGQAPQKTPQGANSFGIFFMFYCSILHMHLAKSKEYQHVSFDVKRLYRQQGVLTLGIAFRGANI